MAIDYSKSALAKPEPRSKGKARRDRNWDIRRSICRSEVYERAGGCCERCGAPLILRPSDAQHEFQIANINEEPPRSRGGDPLDPGDCVCLCCHCHALVTNNYIAIEWKDPERKARGGSIFIEIRALPQSAKLLRSRYVE